MYIDNVAVDARAQARVRVGVLEASSDVAVRGAGFLTRACTRAMAARRLPRVGSARPRGFRSKGDISGEGAQWSSPRLAGLVLLRARLRSCRRRAKAAAAIGIARRGRYDECDECVCHPAGD